jgi:hypothetical protein
VSWPRHAGIAALGVALVLAGSAAAAPRLAVEPTAFDFGRALQKRQLQKQFVLRNHGDATLLLQAPESDCGCTAALLNEHDRELAAGRSTTLLVTLDTRENEGRVTHQVLLRSNDPERPVVVLNVSATVERAPKKP